VVPCQHYFLLDLKMGTLQFKVRLDEALHASIKSAAEQNNRSVNAEIVNRLQKSFEADHGVVEARTTSTSGDPSLQPTYEELKEALIAIAKTNALGNLDKKLNELDKTLEEMSIKINRISKG